MSYVINDSFRACTIPLKGKVRTMTKQGFFITSRGYLWIVTDWVSEHKVMGNSLGSKSLTSHVY